MIIGVQKVTNWYNDFFSNGYPENFEILYGNQSWEVAGSVAFRLRLGNV